MVQVSVTVRDKHGDPVTGLKKEDFTILDGGQPQDIAVFSAETPTPPKPFRKLPPNIFTNRHEALGEPPGTNTIILFDALNTSPPDQSFAREQVLKFLKTMQPQDHFAIYALANQVEILHEFTQDDASLIKAINDYKVADQAPAIIPFTNALDFAQAVPAFLPFGPQESVNPSTAVQREIIQNEYDETRLYPLISAFIAIANHVAGIPGRKNLIWISGGTRLQLGSLSRRVNLAKLGYKAGGMKTAETGYELFRAAAESFNYANVALYGVDVKGVEVDSGISPGNRNVAGTASSITPNPMASSQSAMGRLAAEQDTRDSFRMLADETGGLALYGNNRIDEGMTHAFDDGRFAYTIGYYPNHGKWDGSFRKIQVKVKTPDVRVRNRDGYFASRDNEGIAAEAEQKLKEAANSPLDSTAIGMMVSGQHVKPPTTRELDFQVGVNVAQLALAHSAGHWKGGIDLMFVQRTTGIDVVAAEKKHLGLDFTDEQYQNLLKAGAIFERHVEIAPDSDDVRVIVQDSTSGVIGSVTVPMKTFFPKPSGSAAKPAKLN